MLSEQQKLAMQATPSMASVHWDFDDDSKDDIVSFYQQYNKLPISIKRGLNSEEVTQLIFDLSEKYFASDLSKTGEVSRIVREVFIKRIHGDEIKKRSIEKLKINPAELNNFLTKLAKIIETARKTGISQIPQGVDNLSIKQALKKYESLGEQLISLSPIKLDIFPEMVRPSIKNWLEDYLEKMGAEEHDSLERNQYLYETANAKKLLGQEKKKLAYLLKSFDEDSNVAVDIQSQALVFEETEREDYQNIKEFQRDFDKKEYPNTTKFREKYSKISENDQYFMEGNEKREDFNKINSQKSFNQSQKNQSEQKVVDLSNNVIEEKKKPENNNKNVIDLSEM